MRPDQAQLTVLQRAGIHNIAPRVAAIPARSKRSSQRRHDGAANRQGLAGRHEEIPVNVQTGGVHLFGRDSIFSCATSENGLVVFKNNCSVCHQVNDIGMDFGPKLSEIGSKLSKEAQYIAIVHPDAGISFGYEGYIVKTKDGSTYGGVISSRTETDITMKIPGGTLVELKTADVNSIDQMENSMMPSGLEKAMSTQELVDLVEYLMTLKKK